jgi:ATP-dependent DNA helicase RecQ
VGHLARAGVVRPAPAAADRVRGRMQGPFDRRALAACRDSAGEAERARWRQYRAVWAFVEGGGCRRQAILRHFGDRAAPAPAGPCCDVCDPSVAPQPLRRPAAAAAGELDAAILEVVGSARPAVGRTRAVEILRGGRSQAIARHSYDGLPGYGAFSHLRAEEVMARVDALVERGSLRSTGGRFPRLAAA